jgi:predicted Rossmann fold nucleotide-binding protein DprA/Smf involved in DNA uptake
VVEELPRDLRELILGDERGTKSARGPIQPQLECVELSGEEERVLALLATDKASHIDELIEQSGLRPPELMNALLGLEMKDRIRELRGKTFIKRL